MHEFRWGVKPAIPGKWHGTLEHDGFDVEIACDWIEVRKEDHHDLDVQQRNAKQIVDGVIRRIGLADKMRFTATLGSVSRFDPQSNRRDINVFVSDSLGLKASAHADVVVTSADGRIVADSRKDRMDELFSFVDTSAANETLRRMSDYMLGTMTTRRKNWLLCSTSSNWRRRSSPMSTKQPPPSASAFRG